jgi:hypothetical protein
MNDLTTESTENTENTFLATTGTTDTTRTQEKPLTTEAQRHREKQKIVFVFLRVLRG